MYYFIRCHEKVYDFPDLKNLALEQYRYWKAETVVEAKATGQPIHELEKLVPVIDYVPAKGRDKHTRINSVAQVLNQPCL